MEDRIIRPMRVLGEHAAQRAFAHRGKGKSPKTIRVTEKELADAMSLVAQAAWNACMAAVQKVREQTDREIEEEGGEP